MGNCNFVIDKLEEG